MHRVAWLGDITITDAVDRGSVAEGLAPAFWLEPARNDFLRMDQLRLLLCDLGHHDVHRMDDDAVLRAVEHRIEGRSLAIVPAQAMMELLFESRESRGSGSGGELKSSAGAKQQEAPAAPPLPPPAEKPQPAAASGPPVAKSARVEAPVPGLFDSIDPDADVPGLTMTDKVVGLKGRRTTVVAPDGLRGHVVRHFDPSSREWVMDQAFFDAGLPRWVDTDPPMVPGKGTPLITYLDLRQMQTFGIAPGTLRTAKMSNVQNVEAICQLATNLRKGMNLDAALRDTHSVKYAESELIQSGHRIRSARLSEGVRERFDEMLAHYEGQDPRKRPLHDAILKRYGIKRTDPVLWGFNIHIDLEPFPNGGKA